jgi:hypothetical protein
MISNHELFYPATTGSPRLDVYNHVARLSQPARIDFEEHTLAGDLIIRIEPDLGGAAEDDARILALPYALRFFGHQADATEFIRCVKLIAGDDARPFNLQTIAAHYYQQARRQPAAEVLKEMALLALELAAVTASNEELLFDEPETTGPEVSDEWLTPEQRRELWERRAAEVLDESEGESGTNYFDAEIRSLSRLFRAHASGFSSDETAAHLLWQSAALAAGSDDLEEAAELFAAYEAGQEQYDEGHVVSLHMNDGERVVVAGRIDDDVDETSLPPEARHLAAEIYELYVNGFPRRDEGEKPGVEGVVLDTRHKDRQTGTRYVVPQIVYGLDTWLNYAVEAVYHERTPRTVRQVLCVPEPAAPARKMTHPVIINNGAKRTVQSVTLQVPATFFHDQTSTIEVCPQAAERDLTRTVLETLLARWQRDFHLRALNSNAAYRGLTNSIIAAEDTADIARLKQQAWQEKEARQLSLKHFTALMTQAETRQALLESRTWRITREEAGVTRTYIPAQPVINRLPTLKGGSLTAFAQSLHAFPRQEQERVRAAFQTNNAPLYARVRDGLKAELKRASPGKLRYFRWACYGLNKPEHPFHTLTQADRAAVWELLNLFAERPAATPDARPNQPTLPGLAPAGKQSAAGRRYAAGH